MRKILCFALCFLFLSQATGGFSAQIDMNTLKRLTAKYQFCIVMNEDDPAAMKFIYADYAQHVHVYAQEKGRLVLDWETTNLASRIVSLFVADLFKDKTKELVIATEAGRILVYDAQSYDLIWENLQHPFKKINCMTASDIDGDPQDELIFIADDALYIYDSLNRAIEWQSQERFTGQEILVDNLDDDPQPEIILNSGSIIDSRFYNTEFEIEGSFGDRIRLFDMNGDGIPEIFGEYANYSLRIYDIYAEREIW
ncbi:MAG: hypothetical protein HY770_00015 [Chitinivibrionia bacterium]|nr:hypothetical protein [Chitinivibrionia bacterium]